MEESYLRFFSYHQRRRIRVIENILKNKRTVANLFWAEQYGQLNFLGANRQLTRKKFDNDINKLCEKGLIKVDNENQAILTEEGVAVQQKFEAKQYCPYFYNWFWVANTYRVMERLMLAIQVVSEYSYHQARYIPLQTPYGEMEVVKRWFSHNYRQNIVSKLHAELLQFGKAIASENEALATDFFNMMVGHDIAGWTAEQAGKELKMSEDDLRLMRHDEMLAIATYALKIPGVIQQLLGSLLNETPLSRSAQVTYNSYQNGLDIPNIARQRHLKENTIREHLLEAAIMLPKQVNWDALLPNDKREQLKKLYKGIPTDWQYQGADHDNQAFYEYRLYQIYQGVINE